MRRVGFLCTLALLVAACQEPFSSESFVPGGGPYEFVLDLTDSTAAYDLDLYSRLDGNPEELVPLQGTMLRAEWHSPSDSLFVEKVYLPLKGTCRSYYSRQIYQPYREDVRVVEPGIWTLVIRQEDRSQLVPFRGMGLVVRKKK